MPRLRILNVTEREAYDRPPMMNAAERRRAFDLPASLIELAGTVQNPAQRIGLLVSAAYFGVAKRFFVPRHYRERDVAHAARRLRLPPDVFEASQYPARARQRHELAILDAHGMRRFDRASETELTVDIDAMAATHLRPKLIFLRCLDLLGQRRVQLPSEHRLTALVASAMARRKRHLIERVEQVLTSELGGVLDGLLASGDGPQGPGEGTSGGKRPPLTLLKRLTQSTGPKDVRSRVAHLLEVRAIHDRLRDVLPAIGLGREGIAYFAGGVLRARLSQLHQRSDPDRHLHAIAFVAHQYARLQDNLVDTLLTSVQAHLNACRREHKELRYAERRERDERLARLVEALDQTVQGVAERLGTLERATIIVHERDMGDADKLAHLRMLLPADGAAFAATAGTIDIDPAIAGPGSMPAVSVIDDVQSPTDPRSSVGELRRALADGASGADYDAVLERRSVRLQKKVSPILRVIALRGDEAACELIRALDHFRERDGAVGPGAPHAFLDPDERRAVAVNGAVARVSLHKAFLFAHVARAIKAGTLNLQGSTKYRPLDDYLIGKKRWSRERDALIERAGLAELADPARVLAELNGALHRQYVSTNGRIASVVNPFFRRSARHRFTIATPAVEDDEADAEPLWPLLPGRHVVPLPEVLATVNRHAGFSTECRPWQQTRQHETGRAGDLRRRDGTGLRHRHPAHGAHRPRGLGARARAGGKLAPVARQRAGGQRPDRAPVGRPRPARGLPPRSRTPAHRQRRAEVRRASRLPQRPPTRSSTSAGARGSAPTPSSTSDSCSGTRW